MHIKNYAMDYTSVINLFRRYRRNGGKKSLDEGKANHCLNQLRAEIGAALGVPGTIPPCQTVRLDMLENVMDFILKYLTDTRKRKTNGGLLKLGAYASLRSSITYLFHQYRYVPNQAFQNEMKEVMDGVKRYYTYKSVQSGEGNIWDGDRKD